MSSFDPSGGGNYQPSWAPPGMPSGGRSPFQAALITIALVGALAVVAYLFLHTSHKRQKPAPAEVETASSEEEPAETSSSPSAGAKAGEIYVLDPYDNELIHIKKKDASKYKVIVGKTTLKAKVESDRIKIKDDAGNTFIKVKLKEDGFKVTDGNDTTIVKIKPSERGYKVKNETETIARVKRVGSKVIVTSDGGTELGFAEAEGENWAVKDGSGATLFTVHGASGEASALLLVLRDNPLAQAGLLVYLNEFK